MTPLQKETLRAVQAATPDWFRARSTSVRIHLANLYRQGAVERRAWRGIEGAFGTAYEYRIASTVSEEK